MSIRVDGDGRTVSTDLRLEGTNVTGAPTATGVTALETGLLRTVVHKVRLDWRALAASAAGATADLTLWTLPAGFVLQRVLADVTTVFAGPSVTDVDVTVGSSAGGNQFMVTFDVDTAAIVAGQVVAGIGAGLVDATRADVTVTSNAFAATTLQCRFTAAGADANVMTSGEMNFYIIGCQLPV